MTASLVDLNRLLCEPSAIDELSAISAVELLRALGNIQGLLLGRILAGTREGVASPAQQSSSDRLLIPAETAERLSVKRRWLYQHADRLPFTRRLSSRTLRFSEAGIARYLAGKKLLK